MVTKYVWTMDMPGSENVFEMRQRRGRRLIVFGVLLMAFALLAFLVVQPAMDGYGGQPGADTSGAELPAITSLTVAATGLLFAIAGLVAVLRAKTGTTPPQAGR